MVFLCRTCAGFGGVLVCSVECKEVVVEFFLKKIVVNVWLFGNNVVSLQSEILSMPYRRKISGS